MVRESSFSVESFYMRLSQSSFSSQQLQQRYWSCFVTGLTAFLLAVVVSGCSLSAPPRPELAQPDVWPVQPRSVFIVAEKAVDDPSPVDDDAVNEVSEAVDYSIGYLEDEFGMTSTNLESDPIDLKIYIDVWRNNDEVHYGAAYIVEPMKTCYILLNYEKIDVPIFSKLSMRTAVLHEIGHCLGLVVTATESGYRFEGERLNHCRHTTCSMTRQGIASLPQHAIGWLINVADGNPEFCDGCEAYLKGRLK